MITTPHVRRAGLSAVEPARMAQGIAILARMRNFPRRRRVEELDTDAHLPAAAGRAMAQAGEG